MVIVTPKFAIEWVGDVREKKNPLLPGFIALQCSSPKFTFGASDAIRLNQDGLLEKHDEMRGPSSGCNWAKYAMAHIR